MLPGSIVLTFDGVSVVLVAGSTVSFSGGEEGLCSCNSEDKSCWKRREGREGRRRGEEGWREGKDDIALVAMIFMTKSTLNFYCPANLH